MTFGVTKPKVPLIAGGLLSPPLVETLLCAPSLFCLIALSHLPLWGHGVDYCIHCPLSVLTVRVLLSWRGLTEKVPQYSLLEERHNVLSLHKKMVVA